MQLVPCHQQVLVFSVTGMEFIGLAYHAFSFFLLFPIDGSCKIGCNNTFCLIENGHVLFSVSANISQISKTGCEDNLLCKSDVDVNGRKSISRSVIKQTAVEIEFG